MKAGGIMGHRRMSVEDVYEILRRWHAGQNVSRIAAVEGCDRKTVRKYLQKLNEAGLRIGKKLPDKERIWQMIESKILSKVESGRPAYQQLEALQQIIRDMILDPKEPLKPKK
jgi:predicted transcriptional regulator